MSFVVAIGLRLNWVASPCFDIDFHLKTDLANAEIIFEKATEKEFRFVDDVAQVGAVCMCLWAVDALALHIILLAVVTGAVPSPRVTMSLA